MRPERHDVRDIVCLGRAALVLLAACGEGEPTTGEAPGTARDELAAELGATICEGASWCCASFGYRAPGEACRTSMRNAVMIRIIEAEDEQRTLVPERIDPCLQVFDEAIAAAVSCDDLPAPAELLDLCPDLFTPPDAIAREQVVPCPHDEDTCGYSADAAAACPEGDCWMLVLENVCR